jgi:CBS domain-containing protein
MLVKELMQKKVLSCPSDRPLTEAARIMWGGDVGSVPVTDPQTGKVCGMITDRDICMAACTQGRPISEILIGQVMSRNLHSIRDDQDVSEAQNMMRRHQVRRLPVLDRGASLVGILSLNDVALATAGAASTGMKVEALQTLAAVSRHRETGAAADAGA